MTYVDGDDFNLTADEAEYALHLAQHVPDISQEAARVCALDDLALTQEIYRLTVKYADDAGTLVDRVVQWFAEQERDKRLNQRTQREGAK